jgi:hypothetical protein
VEAAVYVDMAGRRINYRSVGSGICVHGRQKRSMQGVLEAASNVSMAGREGLMQGMQTAVL